MKKTRTEFDDALRGVHTEYDEIRPEQTTDYRAITIESVAALVFGLLSALSFFHTAFLVLPVCGIVAGVAALRKILHAAEEVTGFELSTVGVVLSALFFTTGSIWHYYSYKYSVPVGYVTITFAELQADSKTGRLPERIITLAKEQQNVFIQGFMVSGRTMQGIEHFMIVENREKCKFCSPGSNPTEMIDVIMMDGQTATFRTSAVRVGGRIIVNEDYLHGELPYRIEAYVFR